MDFYKITGWNSALQYTMEYTLGPLSEEEALDKLDDLRRNHPNKDEIDFAIKPTFLRMD